MCSCIFPRERSKYVKIKHVCALNVTEAMFGHYDFGQNSSGDNLVKPEMRYTSKMLCKAPKLELLITSVLPFLILLYTHIKGATNPSSNLSAPPPTLCQNPTLHKNQNLTKLG